MWNGQMWIVQMCNGQKAYQKVRGAPKVDGPGDQDDNLGGFRCSTKFPKKTNSTRIGSFYKKDCGFLLIQLLPQAMDRGLRCLQLLLKRRHLEGQNPRDGREALCGAGAVGTAGAARAEGQEDGGLGGARCQRRASGSGDLIGMGYGGRVQLNDGDPVLRFP